MNNEWKPPDWAPNDAGAVLIQDGDWVLIKDYEMETRKPTTVALHLCDGEKWIPHHNPPRLLEGQCDKCEAKPPEAFLGFSLLSAWDR